VYNFVPVIGRLRCAVGKEAGILASQWHTLQTLPVYIYGLKPYKDFSIPLTLQWSMESLTLTAVTKTYGHQGGIGLYARGTKGRVLVTKLRNSLTGADSNIPGWDASLE